MAASRTRVQVQIEAAECGLACMAMIASHHGFEVTLAELRRQFPLSLKGTRLVQLVHIGKRLGLQGRAVRLDMDGLAYLRLPCVLHWNLDHFVVLSRVGRDKVTVLDPARGECELSLAEVSEQFTGVALELAPDHHFQARAAAPAVTLRQLTGRVTGVWTALAQLLVLSVALQLLVLAAPFFLQLVVDQVLLARDTNLLGVLAIGFALVLLAQVGIGQLRGWAVIFLSTRLNQQWTGNVFAHLLRLPVDFFEKRHIGDVSSRLGSVQSIKRTLTTSFVEAIMDGLLVGVTLCMMLLYSAKLALVTLMAVGLYVLLRAWSYRRLRNITERQLVESSRQQGFLLETLRGMQSLKLAGGETMRRAQYESLVVATTNQEARLSRINLVFSGANQVLFGLERIVVIGLGALLAMQNVFSVGMLMAYLAYKDQFATRTGALIDKWIEFRMLKLHGERLADIVLTAPEDTGPASAPALAPDLRIEVQDVSFRYADDEPWVLRRCSFVIEPGTSVAITGASGCGKTTLLKLLLGLLKPTEGSIRVGGQDLRQIPIADYRAMVGAVMQDDKLFAGSLADNISFFDEAIEHDRIEHAARLASIHDEIVAMPMAYQSLIGDMGSALSGGQQQRVILARALCRQPRLLFLDEATSHLDVNRERLVNDAVHHLDLTRIIVAHRPETIASADRVLAMASGRIITDSVRGGIPAHVAERDPVAT